MRHWWRYFPDFLSAEECVRIVKVGMETGLQQGTVGHGGGRPATVDEGMRRSSVAWIPRSDPGLMMTFHRLHLLGKRANSESFGFDIDDFLDVQFTVYDSENQGEYHRHIDLNWKPDPRDPRAKVYQRKLSMVVQLSPPETYGGGRLELEYDKLPENVFRNMGDVIFFPAFNPHAVTPVTTGIRYSLVSWWEGPQLR